MMNCPNCGSQMRPTPVVWKQGTSVGGSTTVGVGYADGHLVPFSAGTSSHSQTRFAAELGPPETHEIRCLGMLGFVLFSGHSVVLFYNGIDDGSGHFNFWMVAAALVFVVPVVFIVRKWWQNHLWNKNIYPRKYAAWKNSQVCMNCGYGPVLPAQNQGPVPVYPLYQNQVEPPPNLRTAKLRVPPPPPPPGLR